ncbi:MAG: ATP-binding protein, partial [Actinomycetota bacterium]|nr:ATP-binding protein [Actinomycetota bacterium]
MMDLIDSVNFLLATRDTGYKSTALVVAEFIDNSIQAMARRVDVNVTAGADSRFPVEILVVDDGAGMDERSLSRALTFGGSSRFNDRSSLGRYGMGLPNGAMNRARRVEVYSWQDASVLVVSLDIDEISACRDGRLPGAAWASGLPFAVESPTGTAVRLLRCDKVEYKRPSALARKLHADLGRIYRHFLVGGLELRVNGKRVEPADPLFLEPWSRYSGARSFGDPLVYHLAAEAGHGRVSVRFSELPIGQWHDLPVSRKREMGVTGSPSVSVVRAGREIDQGWFFMGAKRRENYDDWWRCEVSFDPVLDELFGITHAKQAVTPRSELLDVLGPDMEAVARALNTRARRRFELARAASPLSSAEKRAARADSALPPITRRADAVPPELRDIINSRNPPPGVPRPPYQITVTDLPTTAAFEVLARRGQVVLLLNSRHPLYRDVYGPLAMSDSPKDQEA